MRQQFGSLERYGAGAGAFLAPLYGCGELPQAFCRSVLGASWDWRILMAAGPSSTNAQEWVGSLWRSHKFCYQHTHTRENCKWASPEATSAGHPRTST